MFLSISQELSNHLPAEALPLQDEASNAHRRVGYEPSLYQVLNALLGFPTSKGFDLTITVQTQLSSWGKKTLHCCDGVSLVEKIKANAVLAPLYHIAVKGW